VKNVKTKIAALVLSLIMMVTLTACWGALLEVIAPEPIPPAAEPSLLPTDAPEPPPPATPPPEPDDTNGADGDNAVPDVTGRPFPFAFTTVDIYGNTVTEASLGAKQLYFVHYWGTWCPPCIAEKPDTAQIVRDYEDRVGFLMLLDDFDNASGAKDVYSHAGFPDSASVITVCARSTFDAQHPVINWISTGFVPTTAIIDADGNMLEQLIGAHFERYAEYLDKHLG